MIISIAIDRSRCGTGTGTGRILENSTSVRLSEEFYMSAVPSENVCITVTYILI